MVYGLLVIPWEQLFLGQPFVIYGFIWEYPLAEVRCVDFSDLVFIRVSMGPIF
jgi:hypothetical protein